jgi:hypothetical protein
MPNIDFKSEIRLYAIYALIAGDHIMAPSYIGTISSIVAVILKN